MFLWINSSKKKKKLLTFQLHNFFWQGTKVAPIISSSLEKVQVQQLSDGKRMYCWKEDSTQEHKLFPTSPFHEEFLFQTPRFLEEFGHIRSKSKRPGEKFPNYLLQFMDKSCQAQGCAHSLHLIESSVLCCSLKLCQNSKHILNFIYCGPPTPPLEVQLFSYCSNPRNWMGFPLSPT